MPKYVLVATSSAIEGKDEQYNAWYDEVHLKDLLAIPGVKSGRRFSASAASPAEQPGQYLAIYEIEADDGGAVMAELGRRLQTGEMELTDTVDKDSARLWLWEERA
jgi:hypothetical protein